MLSITGSIDHCDQCGVFNRVSQGIHTRTVAYARLLKAPLAVDGNTKCILSRSLTCILYQWSGFMSGIFTTIHPRGSIGSSFNVVCLTWALRDLERMATCGKALGVLWWMEPLGSSLEYSKDSLGRILKAPFEISSGKPSASSSARPLAKNPWGRRPLGFLALGLASDAALGLPSENP